MEKLYAGVLKWAQTDGPRTLVALAILIVGFLLLAVLRRTLVKIFNKTRIDPALQHFLARMIIIILQILLVLFAIEEAGIKMTLFATLIGALGVAAGLALSGTLQNFTSGILILLLKPYRIGDNVITQGQEGVVREIQLFSTIITTLDNRAVIIPNSQLSNNVVTNNSLEGKRRLDIELKFASYATDLGTIRDSVSAALQATEGFQKDPPPSINVSGLDVDGWRVMIRAWVKADPYVFERTKFAFQENLLRQLLDRKVKLPGT